MEIVIGYVQPASEMALRPGPAVWLEAMFEEHYPRIVSMLARLIGDRGCAEEVAAEVFSKLSSRGIPEGASETAWIYRVATNAGLDAAKSNARRRRREQEAVAESLRTATQPGALDELLRQERRLRVQTVLATLKPREAELLLLRASGLAYKELAESLGINRTSVGTMLARAETEFERKFRARYGDDV
jgi:RNA polymerase sigma-70 factor (ECF subfamily)